MRVLLFQEDAGPDRVWLGVALEVYTMSNSDPGADVEQAKRDFLQQIERERSVAREYGYPADLSHITPPTPQEFHDCWAAGHPVGESDGIEWRVGDVPPYKERRKKS